MLFKKIISYYTLIILLLIPTIILCQNLGRPFVTNFSPKEYSAGSQNWSAVQDERGRMLFANQRGVLIYDGLNWDLVSVLDNRTVFSLLIDSNNVIWCGAQNDFGFINKDSIGAWQYISMTGSLPDSIKPIGKIRCIEIINNTIYFSSPQYLFRLQSDSIKFWKSNTSFYRQFQINDQLYIYESKSGIKAIKGDSLIHSKKWNIFNNDPITDVLKLNDHEYLISAWKSGIHKYSRQKITPFKTEINDELSQNPIIDLELLDDKFVLTGFNFGSYLINRNGSLIKRFNKKIGLSNELCNDIYLDKTNSLWFSNNYGISRVEVLSQFELIGEPEGLIGNVIDLIEYNDKLIVITDNKVYKLDKAQKLLEIEGLELCWNGLVYENEILFAGNSGIFIYEKGSARRLNILLEKCFTLEHSERDSSIVYVGGETGISIIKKVHDNWQFERKIREINDEVRQIVETPNGDLWVMTLGQGIIHYNGRLNQIKRYGLEDGLRDLKYYKAVEIDGKLYFYSTNSPILRFDSKSDKFVPATEILSENVNVSRMVIDNKNNLWLKKNSKEGIILSKGIRTASEEYVFDDNIFRRINHYITKDILPANDGSLWIGHQFGLIKFNTTNKLYNPNPFPVIITEFRYKDSLISKSSSSLNSISLSHKENSIRFRFTLPAYERKESILFQYYLEGFEKTWSKWTSEPSKDYTNLFEGDYTFHVRGKDIYGKISSEDSIDFTISPPWYRSSSAYISYFIIFLVGLYIVDKVRTKQVTRKNEIVHQRQLKVQRQIEKAKSEERQIIRERTARDFHDELGHILTKISLYTELAKGKSYEIETKNFLNKIESNATLLSSGVKDLIWTLDNRKDSYYDLLIRIIDFGENLFEYTDILFQSSSVDQSLTNKKISMENRKNILLIFKEAMNNCLKYSKCSEANFNIVIKENDLVLVFEDNGIGFDVEKPKQGNGLQNMKSRTVTINAELNIYSKKGGTQIALTIQNYANE